MDDKTKKEFLRHTLATISYRAGKAIANTPETFGDFKASDKTRTPIEILAHMGDLFDWALSIAKGKEIWNNTTPLPWADEVNRFFASLNAFDDYLASDAPFEVSHERIFQGPIADALTHVGQLNLLRGMLQSPVKGENYFAAQI